MAALDRMADTFQLPENLLRAMIPADSTFTASGGVPREGVRANKWRLGATKVSFECRCCGGTWSSYRGAGFVYVWHEGGVTYLSCVLFKQDCKSCGSACSPETYVDVMAEKIQFFDDLYNRRLAPRLPVGPGMRNAEPGGEHDAARCGACRAGECRRAHEQIPER